jgi:hypothetical protein
MYKRNKVRGEVTKMQNSKIKMQDGKSKFKIKE